MSDITDYEAQQIEEANASGLTPVVFKIPGRGHSLTIDHGWQEVADIALAFVQKHAQP